jgi:hypothetical protein
MDAYLGQAADFDYGRRPCPHVAYKESFGNFEADHQTGRASSRALNAAMGTYQEAWLDRMPAR